MFTNLQNRNLIAYSQRTLLGARHKLHTQTPGHRARTFVNSPEGAKSLVGLRIMTDAGVLVYIWHAAARCSAGDVVLVEPDLDLAPGVFVVGFWTGDDQICAEPGGGEAGCGFGLWHLALDVADRG
jgi:hypothetical protein